MKIYLVRHGESQANKLNVFLGHGDLDLTEKGIEQAKITAEYLSAFKIDKIYSSDLSRAYNTALATAEKFNLPIIKEQGLREIECGAWDFMSYEQVKTEFKESFDVWFNDIANARCDGGESIEEVQIRMVSTLEKIAKENPDKTVAVFSHATAIRTFAGYCTGEGKYGVAKVEYPSNASVTEIDYENGVFNITNYSVDYFMGDKATAFPKHV